MPTVQVTYTLQPPSSTPTPGGLSSSVNHEFHHPHRNESVDSMSYYTGLREVIAHAKSKLGQELTEWRDAVGKAEQSKEGKGKKDDDEEEEEEEREEA